MMKSNKDAASSQLTREEVQFIEQETSRIPDQDLTYFEAFAMKSITNPWAESGVYFVADSDVGVAKWGDPTDSAPQIKVGNQRVAYSITTVHVGFTIPTGDIQQSRSWGRPLNTEYVARSTRAVNEQINKKAYVGTTDTGETGILEMSGVTSIAGTNWQTAGIDLANEVIKYVNGLPVVFRQRPYTMVLADQEWKKISEFFNSTAAVGERSHLQRIQAALPNLTIAPPEVNLTAGTALAGGGTVANGVALLIPKDEKLVSIPMAMAPNAITEDMKLNKGVEGEVMARCAAPIGEQPTSVGKITGLAG